MPSDPLADKPLYPSSHADGIPDVPHAPLSAIPQTLIPYRTRLRGTLDPARAAAHFFLYDAIFQSVWNAPAKAERYLKDFAVRLTPDFSLSADMPRALQVYNVYRARWCGAHWAAAGAQVIPTVSWADAASLAFCLAGVARHSVVALTTLGTRRHKAQFLYGFDALIERVQPAAVLCYGQPFPEMARVRLHVYPSRYDQFMGVRDGR